MKHYVNASFGKVNIVPCNDGVVMTQNRNGTASGSIALTPDDMEKLAKALLAIKRDEFPNTAPSTYAVPLFHLPKPPVPSSPVTPKTAANYMAQQKATHQNAYAKWTDEEAGKLKQYRSEGKTVSEIATLLKRNKGAIENRMKKLGLT